MTNGVTTSDGWAISFERLLIALGRLSLDGSSCNSYSEARYDRLFDFAATSTPQKVGEVFGLNECDLTFRVRTPSSDALLATGVTSDDLAQMRTPGSDAWSTGAGVAVLVRGSATRAGTTKRFEWSFRQGWSFHDCPRPDDAGLATALALGSGDSLQLGLVVRGEELFRQWADDAAPLVFDAMANADADGDQSITLDELDAVPAPVAPDGGALDASTDADASLATDAAVDADAADGASGPTLADVLYGELVPRMLRLGDSGACSASPSSGGGR